jgi:DNA-directed RNA polymerase subunit RPC12/RpoP
MKIQCPACGEIAEMVDFSTSEEGLGFTCGSCGKPVFLSKPGAKEEDVAPPERAYEVTCPKCGHGQTDTYACHRCGLVFEKFDRSNLPPDPREAASLWKEIRLLPSDESRHEAFLDACLKANRPDYAARQYRLLLREPAGKAVAEKMLERLFERAQAQLAPVTMTAEGRREKGKRKSKILVWIILAACGGLLLYYIATMTDMLNRMAP